MTLASLVESLVDNLRESLFDNMLDKLCKRLRCERSMQEGAILGGAVHTRTEQEGAVLESVILEEAGPKRATVGRATI